jgi:hypothetical protein
VAACLARLALPPWHCRRLPVPLSATERPPGPGPGPPSSRGISPPSQAGSGPPSLGSLGLPSLGLDGSAPAALRGHCPVPSTTHCPLTGTQWSQCPVPTHHDDWQAAQPRLQLRAALPLQCRSCRCSGCTQCTARLQHSGPASGSESGHGIRCLTQ